MLTAHNGGVLALLLLLGILLRLTGSATASRPQQAVLPVGVHAFFYLWYGTPEVDGSWRHWDHEVSHAPALGGRNDESLVTLRVCVALLARCCLIGGRM